MENIYKQKYLKWKRKNVTIRGIKKFGSYNNIFPTFGKGLYTVPLSNLKMAKSYGKIYYVINAIPKNPKIVQTLNDAEIFIQELINKFCIKNGIKYNLNYFEKNTSIENQIVLLGYDGLIISGREMVNYKPKNILYFENEIDLQDYFFINYIK